MTRIDFYVLGSDSEQKRMETVCRLIEKAVGRKKSVFVHTEEDELARALDTALWEFRPESFIPHQTMLAISADEIKEPGSYGNYSPVADKKLDFALDTSLDLEKPECVEIACGQEPRPDQRRTQGVLLNLGLAVPAFFSRFERTLEIVSPSDADRIAGRKRYAYYKERGYPIKHHNL